MTSPPPIRLKPRFDKSSLPIILWNLTPLAGVLFLGWEPVSVFICYALETIVLGIFNAIKLLVVHYYGLPPQPDETGVKGWWIIPFFLFHYFFFVFVQLSIFFSILNFGSSFGITSLFRNIVQFMTVESTNIALAVFTINSSLQFVNGFIMNGAYTQRSMGEQMFEPYPRIFVQQFVVILGAFVFQITGSGWPILIIFILIKAYFDLLLKDLNLVAWAKKAQASAQT